MSHTDQHTAYREFRKDILARHKRSGEERRPSRYCDEPVLALTALRVTIKHFREYIRSHLQSLLDSAPESEQHIRRALAIPPAVRLTVNKWQIAGQVGRLFLPEKITIRQAKNLLSQVRSFEGREYIFDLHVKRTIQGQWYYSSSLDFTFMRLDTACSVKELETLNHLDEDLIRALLLMGLRQPAEVVGVFAGRFPRPNGSIVRMLVEEGVIRCPDELSWVQSCGLAYRSSDAYTKDELTAARQLIQVLMANDVSRALIAGVFKLVVHRFDVRQLKDTIGLLRGAGIDNLSQVFESIGECLWQAESERWQFLLDTVGVRSSEEVGQFLPILQCRYSLSRELVIGLQELGADLAGIAACQSMLVTLARRENSPAPAPVTELKLLAAAPHSLSIEQLGLCTAYLQDGRDLESYLQVLTRQGYSSAQAVIAFMACYERVSPTSLDRWLTIVGARGRDVSFQSIAQWVQQAGAGGYIDAYEYLMDAVEMRDMVALEQALKLVRVGPSLLRYLVEDRRLTTFKAIRSWYEENLRGVKELRGWAAFDALDKVLLDDAYQRKTFDLFEGNRRSIDDAISQRVKTLLGSWPFNAEETVRETYRQAKEAASLRERQLLLPMLALILSRTGGILLRSLLQSAWEAPDELELQIERLVPLLDELIAGRGPTGEELNTLQADAIALIYRTDVHTVTSQWSQLIGHEQDVAHLKLRDSYDMSWRCAQWQLKGILDQRGLNSLVSASQFSARFKPGDFKNIFDACKNLKPRYLDEASADIHMLVPHLGVLLAAGSADSTVAHWNAVEFEALARVDEESSLAHQGIEALHTFLNVSLPDALDAHLDQFVRRFDDDDAAFLASRLCKDPTGVPSDGRSRLARALDRTRKTVLGRYLVWAEKEQGKFAQKASEEQIARFSAIVSKHPAAFFAREATKLCTRYNKHMWCEKRHAHLVVFDRNSKQVVGMAMLYVEVLPALDSKVRSLVIRAINPTESALSSYTQESIVDAFFDVARCIAVENELACVAFPENGGLHVLSNHDGIVNDIKERYVNRADSDYSGSVVSVSASFDAYERGSGKVDKLYVIWQRARNLEQQLADVDELA